MRQIYNKSALEKLSSPDQLDRMVLVAGRYLWVFFAAVALILAVVFYWAFFTIVPVNLEASGIYLHAGATEILYAQNSGLVSEVLAQRGDMVSKGDVLAYISVTDEAGEVEKLNARIAEVEAIGFESQGDLPSTDNAQLLEIKRSLMTMDEALKANAAALELKKALCDEAKKDARAKKEQLGESEAAYYGSVQTSGQTPSIEYSQAQSDYSLAQSNASSMYNLYLQYQNAFDGAFMQFRALLPCSSDGSCPPNPEDPYYVAAAAANPTLSLEYSKVMAAYKSMQAYQNEYANAQYALENAQARSEQAKRIYEGQQDYESARSAFNTVAYSEYSRALSDYVNAESKYQSLKSEVSVSEMQLDLERAQLEEQTLSLRAQFENTKGAILDQLVKERQNYTDRMERATVEASADGELHELTITEGSAVQQGNRIGSVMQKDAKQSELLCYVPLAQAKQIAPGMTVRVYPSTVNRQEYGHISGVVSHVGEHPASTLDMYTGIGNESLVSVFEQQGPVLEVRCTLDKDESTLSGYDWSTQKGAEVILLPYTYMSVSIETQHKRPIDVILPYIKDKLSFQKHFDEGRIWDVNM